MDYTLISKVSEDSLHIKKLFVNIPSSSSWAGEGFNKQFPCVKNEGILLVGRSLKISTRYAVWESQTQVLVWVSLGSVETIRLEKLCLWTGHSAPELPLIVPRQKCWPSVSILSNFLKRIGIYKIFCEMV